MFAQEPCSTNRIFRKDHQFGLTDFGGPVRLANRSSGCASGEHTHILSHLNVRAANNHAISTGPGTKVYGNLVVGSPDEAPNFLVPKHDRPSCSLGY